MNKIKQIRIEKGMTQEELANLVGISRQALSAIENNKSEPKIRTLINISNALGCVSPWHLYKN